jgi:hypothetical protein
MRIVINKDLNTTLHIGADSKLKDQDLSTLSFGETEKVKSLKEAIKKDPKNESLQTDLKFANIENQKLRHNVMDTLEKKGIEFNYGKIEGKFKDQKWVPLKEGEKFEKGAYVINSANINKFADFLKENGKNIAVCTSYLGKTKKFEADPLYMAEVKRIRTSALYAQHTGIKYDGETKKYHMPAESLKRGFELEKKDGAIIGSAFNNNLDSVSKVYAVAGLDEKGQIKGMENKDEKKELVKVVKEMDDTVIMTPGYFNPHNWSKADMEETPEKKEMLNAIAHDRTSEFKSSFVNAKYDFKSAGGLVITKAENPDWKEKLDKFIVEDKGFCEEKTKELEALNNVDVKVDVSQKVDGFTKSFTEKHSVGGPSL